MFSNLIFTILAILTITLIQPIIPPLYSPLDSFFIGMGLYLFTLGLIGVQNLLKTAKSKSLFYYLAHLELLLFLGVYQVTGAQYLLYQISETLALLFTLGLYLLGLYLYHATSARYSRFHSAIGLREISLTIPFLLPLVMITAILEGLSWLPSRTVQHWLYHGTETAYGIFFIVIFNILILLTLLVFLPFAIQKIWRCQDLQDESLQVRLNRLCEKAHFKHAGLKTWPILKHSLTAAIIGVVAPFRYVMFTEKMLKEMTPDMVEAVLAHEIGHHDYRHLIIYPFIILGISVLFFLFSEYVDPIWNRYLLQILPEEGKTLTGPILFILPYLILAALYMRYVFGFFSRLFERQADLHVFKLGIPAQQLIDAFDYIGVANGHSHRQPNWHHYSLQGRIDFLKQAMDRPELVAQYHHKVKVILIGYFSLLILMTWIAMIPKLF